MMRPEVKISRRDIFKLAALGAGAVVAVRLGYHPEHRSTQEALAYLEDRYRLKVHNGVGIGMEESGEVSKPGNFNYTLNTVISEAAKYPNNFFQKNGLHDIYIADNLRGIYGRAYGDTYSLLLAGNVDLFTTTVIAGRGDIFNHEAFHVIDEVDGGYEGDDSAWYHFHDDTSCVPYFNHEEEASGNYPLCGNRYYSYPLASKGNAAEDRAYWAMKLMNPADHRSLQVRVDRTQDPVLQQVLAKKFDFIKGVYERLSGGAMGKQYWRDLSAGKVDHRYFAAT